MRILDIEQNSADWRIWREQGIGASDANAIMGTSRWSSWPGLKLKKVAELRRMRCPHKWRRKREKEPESEAAARGHRLEPVARDLYETLVGIKTRPVCVVHDDVSWLRASLDGLSEDNTIPLEIKCVNTRYHKLALLGDIPGEYFPQVQHQLLVTGLPLLHYWSYADFKHFTVAEQTALVECRPDLGYREVLIGAETRFWEECQAALWTPDDFEEISEDGLDTGALPV